MGIPLYFCFYNSIENYDEKSLVLVVVESILDDAKKKKTSKQNVRVTCIFVDLANNTKMENSPKGACAVRTGEALESSNITISQLRFSLMKY